MIPATSGFLTTDFTVKEIPTKTYKMEIEGDHIRSYVEGQDAMAQTIYRILNTERYQYAIYPWWYGLETVDLYGEPVTYVCPEIQRRIQEALLMDSRILQVTDFSFEFPKKGTIYVTFTAYTIYGELQAEKEVSY